jgi:tetratricopeptide (TPR) repeat protein
MKTGLLFGVLLGLCLEVGAQQPALPVGPVNATDTNAVKNLFFAGLRDKLSDNYDRATTSFNRIIEIDPGNDAAHFELAALYYKQNKLQESEFAVKRAVAINTNNIWYWKLLAELYKRKGNMDELASVFNHMIRLAPKETSYYFDRSNAFFLSGRMDEAMRAYEEIEKKFGSSDALKQAKQRIALGKGDSSSEQALDNVMKDTGDVKSYLNLSGILLDKGRTADALEILKRAKALEPDNFEVDLAMADVYQEQMDFAEASQALKTAFKNLSMPTQEKIKILIMLLPELKNPGIMRDAVDMTEILIGIDPANPAVMAIYGDILYRQGNLRAAETQYLKVLKLNDQQYQVWEQLIAVQTMLGKYAEAMKTGEAALSIYPNQARLYYYQAFAQHRSDLKNEALENILQAQQLDGENADLQALILALQGEILIDEEKFAAADKAFDKAVSLSPDNYQILNNYAYYLALRNQSLPKAESLIKKAAMAWPGNASVADTYALVLLKLGKFEEAKPWIERAIKNNGGDHAVYLEHYGDILFLTGDVGSALVQWERAKAAGNDSEKLSRKINDKKYIK